MRGARAAAALRHENVATVYHFGIQEETGQCFYAMELIEGETLEERVRRTGPLNVRSTISIARQVTDALAAAEKRGLIHRDLKPANLMLIAADDEGGTQDRHRENAKPLVKIIDFGLAKALNAETDPMLLTRDGFVGTPAFASPEQFRRASLDVRSDVYSLGLTLWFALTGKTPFHGHDVEEIQRAQKSGALPIQQLKAARVSSRLISLLESMLALEPGARPGTDMLAARLRRCSAQSFLTRKRTFILAVAIGVLLAGLIWLVGRYSPALEPGGTSDAAAREAYLKGMYIWNKRDPAEYPQAKKYFEKAIALDPHYALAYAGLADVLQFTGIYPQWRRQTYGDSEKACRKALELNPNLAQAHASLGLIKMNYQWDWPAAEQEFRRAIELNPNHATSHHWYAEYLATQGRFEESLFQIKRARELDPASPVIQGDTGKILVFARRFDEAEAYLQETVSLAPNTWGAHLWLAFIYARQKQLSEALVELRELERIGPNSWTAGLSAYVYGLTGDRAKAQQWLMETQKRLSSKDDELPLVYAYVGMGDNEHALFHLERDCDTHATSMTSLRVAPLYDPLRSDPRFVDLLRRVHLAP
jgi:tetratricopeptide (TPR) repeat protein